MAGISNKEQKSDEVERMFNIQRSIFNYQIKGKTDVFYTAASVAAKRFSAPVPGAVCR